MLNEGRESRARLAKRKQWILFNLIQLIYCGRERNITKRIPLCCCHSFLSAILKHWHMPSPVRGKHIKLTQMFCPIHCLTPGSSGFWVQRGPCFLQFVTEYLYQSQNANENHFWHTLRAMWNVNGNGFGWTSGNNYLFSDK